MATQMLSPDPGSAVPKKGLAFWLIFLSICLSLFLSALELTGVSTALPVIVQDLEGSEFAWIGTAYSLASTAFLPMSGCFAEVFGRRGTMLGALVIFALGSALCGSAKTMHWLIAARTVQGLGGGGILSLASIIVSDLVPLRERGAYNGLTNLTWAIAAGIGPIVGGALAAEGQWRWLFYLNLPLCGLSIAMVLVFLKLPTPAGTLQEKLERMDWIGNLLVIISTTGVVLGLTWGGSAYSWSSAAVLVPLVLGLVGYVIFLSYEFFFAKHPMIPFEILNNRTSLSGYVQNFFCPLVTLAATYYLPTYYQACKDASAIRSGVMLLGSTLVIGPAAIAAGVSTHIVQIYRPQLWMGWVLFIVGMAGLTTLTADSSTSIAVGLPVLMGAGGGALYSACYFPVLAPLHVSLNARAIAFIAFGRSFAAVWGITIGSTILQNQLLARLPSVVLQSITASTSNSTTSTSGQAVDLAYALIPLIRTLPEPTRHEVQVAFAGSIAMIWKVMTGLLGLGFISSLFMAGLPLQNVVDEKWTAGVSADAGKEAMMPVGEKRLQVDDASSNA